MLNEIVEKGVVNQKQLVGDLLLEKSNVSKIVNKLQIAELVTVSASSDDARSTVLSPTEKGKQLRDDCMQRLNSWNHTWLQSLNKNEIDSSVRVLEKAGYTFEGRLKKNAIKNGQILDQLLFAKVT